MSLFIKQIILNKMRQITPEDVYSNANQYGFTITKNQAVEISNYVRKNRVNPFNKRDREKMLYDLSQITDQETAMKANQLFNELIKSYGLEHLLE
ncbi:DUF2624 domain-containing protein [Ornithinibacillus scapharcae]|uniref:DUF2624 domain-containing protein n=1 Tax=Ornithinibacillus scapharcae TaxID=1147159 RepID=UPI000225B392|nr:DUF2624 domain-containing protein [Ornithinibacillus scapharcae]